MIDGLMRLHVRLPAVDVARVCNMCNTIYTHLPRRVRGSHGCSVIWPGTDYPCHHLNLNTIDSSVYSLFNSITFVECNFYNSSFLLQGLFPKEIQCQSIATHVIFQPAHHGAVRLAMLVNSIEYPCLMQLIYPSCCASMPLDTVPLVLHA